MKLGASTGLALLALLLTAATAAAQTPLPTILDSTTTTTTTTTTTSTTSTTAATTTTTALDGSATTTTTTAPAPADGEVTALTGTTPTGALSVSFPDTVVLGTGVSRGAGGLSSPLGPVTVTDERGGLATTLRTWRADVTASDFTTGVGGTHERIPKANISYWSGPATAASGLGTPLPGQLTALQAAPLSGAVLAFSSPVAVAGATSASWNPTISIVFPPDLVPGEYRGVITHSAA